MFEVLFKNFMNSLLGGAYNQADYDSYQESIVDGKRRIVYGFNGNYDHEKMKLAIIKAMNHWSGFVAESNDFSSFVITFMFDGKEYFHFTWDKDAKKFITEDPDGSVFSYNFETGTIDRVEPENAGAVEHDVQKPESTETDNVQPKPDQQEPCDSAMEIKKDQNLANIVKERIEAYEDAKSEKQDYCEGCKAFFCPVRATDVFINNIAENTNYMSIYEEGKLVGLMADLVEIIPSDVELPDNMSKVDLYNEIFHNEADLLDTFCQNFMDSYGFSDCHWDAEKNDDGDITSLTVTWRF